MAGILVSRIFVLSSLSARHPICLAALWLRLSVLYFPPLSLCRCSFFHLFLSMVTQLSFHRCSSVPTIAFLSLCLWLDFPSLSFHLCLSILYSSWVFVSHPVFLSIYLCLSLSLHLYGYVFVFPSFLSFLFLISTSLLLPFCPPRSLFVHQDRDVFFIYRLSTTAAAAAAATTTTATTTPYHNGTMYPRQKLHV